ncbi:uncharacterized protein CEXT_48041 [Caerostris extrusa]|uniref:Ig-like domain-containing protein n=1 Tax=Caerostris extrusa TaxID=172846 RepID=A0AAV4TVS5_CAEEX|nr:uncharacterized protein CEXT_48041 [Caerostris extrusa]
MKGRKHISSGDGSTIGIVGTQSVIIHYPYDEILGNFECYKSFDILNVLLKLDDSSLGVKLVIKRDPSPEVTWWRGTTLLDDSFNVTPQGFVRNELFLFELRRSDLLAEYTCQATNTNLTRPRTSAVRLDLNLRPLEVKIAAPHYPLNAGSRKQIICETTGSRPRALLSWWLDGKKIGAGTTDTVSDGGNLTVSTLHLVPTPNDDGKILSCRAENPAVPNSAIEDEWTIRVHCEYLF